MKTRQGFVSNSSSSSFVMIGRKIDSSEITEESFNEKKITVVGGHLYEGRLVINLTWEMFQYLQDNADKLDTVDGFDDLNYYENYFDASEEGMINKNNLPDDDLTVIICEEDHGSPSNLKDIKNYIEDYYA